MKHLEGIHHDENRITRINMPKPVFEELTHHENLYPEFHALRYTKSCLTPEDCVYTISGTDIPETDRPAKKAVLTISYSAGKTKATFTYPSEEKMAA